jgi:hypothetical protein
LARPAPRREVRPAHQQIATTVLPSVERTASSAGLGTASPALATRDGELDDGCGPANRSSSAGEQGRRQTDYDGGGERRQRPAARSAGRCPGPVAPGPGRASPPCAAGWSDAGRRLRASAAATDRAGLGAARRAAWRHPPSCPRTGSATGGNPDSYNAAFMSAKTSAAGRARS